MIGVDVGVEAVEEVDRDFEECEEESEGKR